MKYVITDSISDANKLIKVAAVYIGEQMGLKRKPVGKKSEPWWKRRREGNMKRPRKDVNMQERYMKNELNNTNKYNRMDRKYHLKKKGVKMVTEELKQRLMAKVAKIRRYEERIKQYKHNQMFNIGQERVHKEFNGEVSNGKVIPDAEESKRFWKEIWDNKKEHNKEAEWFKDLNRGERDVK